jgi:protein Mpv17
MIPKIVRAGMQSGSIMCVADALTQVGIEGKSFDTTYDPYRTLRWGAAGFALHGPYFFAGFSRVDKYFGAATSIQTVAKKTAFAQFVLFPPYLILLFSFMGVLEGNQDVPSKVKSRVPEAFMGGCIFWPISNGLNFALVPPSLRVPYVATSAGLWNCYLSWANARGEKAAQK